MAEAGRHHLCGAPRARGERVSEDRHLEYKEALPGSTDAEKREFLADVSALANGAGGDLRFGVREKRDASGAKLGFASEIIGVPDPLDPVRARLESMIRDGITPRVPGIAMRAVDGFERGPVLTLRVPRSWTAPHMVSVSGGQRFFMRTGGGKHPMDVHELRHAFLSNQTALAAARELRAERVGRVLAEGRRSGSVRGPSAGSSSLCRQPSTSRRNSTRSSGVDTRSCHDPSM